MILLLKIAVIVIWISKFDHHKCRPSWKGRCYGSVLGPTWYFAGCISLLLALAVRVTILRDMPRTLHSQCAITIATFTSYVTDQKAGDSRWVERLWRLKASLKAMQFLSRLSCYRRCVLCQSDVGHNHDCYHITSCLPHIITYCQCARRWTFCSKIYCREYKNNYKWTICP